MIRNELKNSIISSVNSMLEDLEKRPFIDSMAEGIDKIEIGSKIFQLQIKLQSNQDEWIKV